MNHTTEHVTNEKHNGEETDKVGGFWWVSIKFLRGAYEVLDYLPNDIIRGTCTAERVESAAKQEIVK